MNHLTPQQPQEIFKTADMKAYQADYYKNNKEKHHAHNIRYYQENTEKVKAYSTKLNILNPELKTRRNKEYYEKHRKNADKTLHYENMKEWRRKNKDKQREYNQTRRDKTAEEAIIGFLTKTLGKY